MLKKIPYWPLQKSYKIPMAVMEIDKTNVLATPANAWFVDDIEVHDSSFVELWSPLSPVGLDRTQGDVSLRVSPNPVRLQEEVFIRSAAPINEVVVYDLQGRQVKKEAYEVTSPMQRLSINDLQPGVYAVCLSGPGMHTAVNLVVLR
jgi:hypothetical protein